MNLRPTVDFMALLAETGVPTTEQAMEAELKKEVVAAGSLITNDSDVSPFWRLVRGVVITPAIWLIRTLLAGHVLPNTFAATATDAYLDLKAWDVDLTRKGAQKTRGVISFVKANPSEAVAISADIWISTERINGTLYRVKPLQAVVSPAGEAVARVVCEAEFAGAAWNLAPGYYNLLSEPVTGILSARNDDKEWITTPGADAESNDALGLRIKNQFSAVGRYHIDAVYRSMLASVAGIRADHIFFEHDAPRGPGTANAYILLEVGTTPASLIGKLNDYVTNQGNHGHGDDLQVMAMPETEHSLHLELWPVDNLGEPQRAALVAGVRQLVNAAFRLSADYPSVTRTWPQSRFSLSQLGRELHQAFPEIKSLHFTELDILSGLAIPRLSGLEVTLHE
ncbi:baseplate J/gp47 family protein [Aeromonas salmonicida]|uniref:baseplate J/gp47 family protein n=1 Tax=Aeromonas salmonicida TaxID=645 RepID=UPI00073C93BC|nr:baseplate J/gp47 family protein [Aeromonas salmonicida]KTA82159.1 phage protein [Aeromonas salmonicida]MDE7527376.1 baseplate J/gp47 family protein [Aeromonas salmonicida]MDE7531627.1 baseplate J/gp47 family protein [Aeromonas salmonicida]